MPIGQKGHILVIPGRRMEAAFAGAKSGSCGSFICRATAPIIERLPKTPAVLGMIGLPGFTLAPWDFVEMLTAPRDFIHRFVAGAFDWVAAEIR